MKSETVKFNKKFPRLMIHEDDEDIPDPMIVLMVTKSKAIILSHNKGYEYLVGTLIKNLDVEFFRPYDGIFKIKNGKGDVDAD